MEHNLAYALAVEGKGSEALAHYSRSLALAPANYAGQYNFGRSLTEAGRPGEAEAHFREAIRLKPDYAEAHYALASMLRNRNALDEAVSEFNRALAGPLPVSYVSRGHNDLGTVLAQQGRYTEAMTHFATAVQFEPGMLGAHVNYANCLVALNRRQEAQAYISRLLQTGGENPDLRQYLNSLARLPASR